MLWGYFRRGLRPALLFLLVCLFCLGVVGSGSRLRHGINGQTLLALWTGQGLLSCTTVVQFARGEGRGLEDTGYDRLFSCRFAFMHVCI